jgi:hypothetical protein
MTLAYVSALVLFAASIYWWPRGDDVQSLPHAPRQALYQHTIEGLRTFCASRAALAGIDDYCAEQARFALKFPECDGSCRALAETHLPQPTR